MVWAQPPCVFGLVANLVLAKKGPVRSGGWRPVCVLQVEIFTQPLFIAPHSVWRCGFYCSPTEKNIVKLLYPAVVYGLIRTNFVSASSLRASVCAGRVSANRL